jgi:hypothetical protein
MADAFVALHSAGGRASTGSTMPSLDAVPGSKQLLSSVTTAQRSTFVGAAGQFWSIVAIGGAMKVKFGDNAVTATASDFHGYVADGQSIERAAADGQYVSVIAA